MTQTTSGPLVFPAAESVLRRLQWPARLLVCVCIAMLGREGTNLRIRQPNPDPASLGAQYTHLGEGGGVLFSSPADGHVSERSDGL